MFLPRESHGQRSLVGYSPKGHRVGHNWSDLTHLKARRYDQAQTYGFRWLNHFELRAFILRILHNYWGAEGVRVAAAAKSLQSCPTLCDPIDGSPQGSPIPGILQARTLEWVAISFSNAPKWKVKVKSLSRVRPSAIPWTAAYQAPLSMGFSRQEYWSGVPLPSLKFVSTSLFSNLVIWTDLFFQAFMPNVSSVFAKAQVRFYPISIL